MRSFHKLWLLAALATAAVAQDRHDWQSLSRLHPGDRVRVSLKMGPVDGEFQNWTPQDVTVGTVVAKREDVIKIERYRHGGSRARHSGIGALIGFGGGFAIGAAVPWCVGLGPCKRPGLGFLAAWAGAVIGYVVGVSLPAHSKELIYSSGPRGARTSNQTTGHNDGGSLAALP